jgi:hypothetical protein
MKNHIFHRSPRLRLDLGAFIFYMEHDQSCFKFQISLLILISFRLGEKNM